MQTLVKSSEKNSSFPKSWGLGHVCKGKPFSVWLMFTLRMSAIMWYIYQGERVFQTKGNSILYYKVWHALTQAKNGNIKDNLKENA